MKLDLLLDPFGTTWEDLRRCATEAEEAGIDGLWTWDHLAGSVHGESSVLESWTVLSALAATTSQVTLGPMVLNVASRRPGLLAVMAATLQAVSGGRLLLGIGSGGGSDTPYSAEHRFLGFPSPPDGQRRQQVREAVATVREVWTGGSGGASGFLRPKPAPPVIVGGFGPKMAALAGEVGDGFNTSSSHPQLEQLADVARGRFAARTPTPDSEFLMTAFGGLDPRRFAAGSAGARRLERAGVERFVAVVGMPYPSSGGLREMVKAARG
jgi:alkanesulfonate monooxygenase SsuD/methylene tetrahydromethanopterin reductase-like flavin-dependent oxidoreductase (luciferase family)